ncbi:MAG: hypothetical protein R2860_08845 [Desulfobacterales bacterium]
MDPEKFGTIDIDPGAIEEGVVKDHQGVAGAIRQLFQNYNIKQQNVAISIGDIPLSLKT